MTSDEATAWLKQVDGTVFHSPAVDGAERPRFVAMVRTPAPPGKTGKIILAFGGSLEDATAAAEKQWQQVWRTISVVH